jgi:hypothetical protein
MSRDLFEITGDIEEIMRHANAINRLFEQGEKNIDWNLVERHASRLQDSADGLYDGVVEDA